MAKTFNVELYTHERDFTVELLEYALWDDLLYKLRQAKPNRKNIINICLDDYDLKQLIGNLSSEANHNKNQST